MRRHRDEAAEFSALYRSTQPDILAYLLRRCPTPEDAADCLAETYAVAWQKRRQMPSGADTRPWLFGVARNVMRRGHEHRGRAAGAAAALAHELHRSGVVASPPGLGEPDPVIAALAQLPQLDQEIITLMSWDGLAPREVATVLGISANVVRVRAHRARARLRSALSDGGVAERPAVSA